ncbi:MAG TPA: hypothetical protein VGQ66_03715 [Candidatus Limnocylindria bacterium]|nr:hypothetical protein [Candidatus Limnocylindria bacterium]
MAETAGYLAGLQRGFEEIGCRCHFIDLTEHPFGYSRTAALPGPSRWRAALARRVASLPRRSWRRLGWRMTMTLVDFLILAWAIGRADLFVFTGHDSLLWRNLDLPLLRVLGKRVVWVFLGSDHRPPYLNGKRVRESRAAGEDGYQQMAERTRAFATIVRRIERRANVVVAMSASAQLHTRSFVHLLAIGIPHAGDRDEPEPPARPRRVGTPVRVLHSPSDPAKGSEAIQRCVAGLEANGLSLEYREITGRPHAEVLDAIVTSDLVVDQLYSDSPLAAFATEAAYRGRAAIVGGYYADAIADDVPADLIPPSRFVAPGQLCAAIEELARDEAGRAALGTQLARFVRERWSPADVARRYVQIAYAGPPAAWLYDPARLRYVHGWGLSEAEIGDYVARFVERCGTSALALDHHPGLRARLLELAASTQGEA